MRAHFIEEIRTKNKTKTKSPIPLPFQWIWTIFKEFILNNFDAKKKKKTNHQTNFININITILSF